MLDGPTMNKGQKTYSVYAGENVTLICGTDLIRNLEPTITWTNPQKRSIESSSHYEITERPNVTLTINNVTESDGGIWKCTIEINSNNLSVECPDPNPSSRTPSVEIEVIVIGKLLMIPCLN